MTTKVRSVAVLGAVALTAGWTIEQAPAAAEPLTYEPQASDGRQLLARDERGSGRVVEAFGDLRGAETIVVFVPGSSWDLQAFGDADAPMSPRTAARSLADLADERAGDEVAAVGWLGYRPPAGIGIQALRSERAEAGAAELARFVDWLPDDAAVTLACHSYGTVVCGKAARDVQVANIVSVGGAGMDAGSVADLDTTANVWAARAPEDAIRFLPEFRFAGFGHGRTAVSEGFGARRIGTGAAREHGDYYRPGGETMTNVLRIARGRHAAVSHA